MKNIIAENPDALFWASFNRFEMRLPGQAVAEICQSGSNDAAVADWADKIRAQMEADAFPNRPTPDKIRAELGEHGAWDDNELGDDAANWRRLVWCAAWNIFEDDRPDCSAPVKLIRLPENKACFHPWNLNCQDQPTAEGPTNSRTR